MKRIVVLAALGAALGAIGSMACGGGDKPPLTPDSEQTTTPADSDGGAPAPADTSSVPPSN